MRESPVCWLCGSSYRGEKATFRYLFSKGKRWSLLAARNVAGMIKWKVMDKNTNSDEFLRFVVEELVPLMNPYSEPNSILALDNASYHKNGYLKKILGRFLPPYSPYLNPIELDFNTVKQYIRRHYCLARTRPVYTLYRAMATLTDVDVTSWIERVGYFDHVGRL